MKQWSRDNDPTFPMWIWIAVIVAILMIAVYTDGLYKECVKSGKTRLECYALVNVASGNGAVILDERKP